jgi:CheY-like chemotaxis protein
MARNPVLPPEEQENLSIIQRSGEHLMTLINQILDLSKIEAGRLTLNEKNVDLHRLLNDLHDMFSLKAQNKGLHLIFERADGVPRYVQTDEVRLRQVLINLLNNAIKFTEEGIVELRIRNEELGMKKGKIESIRNSQFVILHFSVADTGPGIAPQEMEKLFEAFAQTEIGRQVQEGTGLGLPISRKFVQLMGGDIRVTSTVGQGTMFTFEIQAHVGDKQAITGAPPARRAIALEPDQPRYRLLIADDRPDSRMLLVKLLKPFGFELKEAANGQEALDIWRHWMPHLIWMDLWMPMMGGYEVTQQIRATDKGKDTVIITLSASSFEEERAIALSQSCDDFLRKPFREIEIFELLHKHLGIRFVYEERQTSNVKCQTSKGEKVLTSEALAGLPKELRTELQQAAEEVAFDRALGLIDQIRQQNVSLAEALAELVKNYRFDILQAWFEKIE